MKVEKSRATYTELLRIYSGLKNFEQVEKVFELAKGLGKVDIFTCSAYLQSFTKQLKSVAPTSNIDDCIEHQQILAKVGELTTYMESEQIKSDAQFLQTLIKTYITLNDLPLAFETFSKLMELGIYPNNVITHTLLDGCFKLGDVERGMGFLARLQRQGLGVSMPMYRTCLQGLLDNNDGSNTFGMIMQVYDQIRALDLVTAMYNIVLEACVREYDLQTFQSIWDDLLKRSNSKDKASKAQGKIPSRAVPMEPKTVPNSISLQKAIAICLASRDTALARKFIQDCTPLKPSQSDILKLLGVSLQGRTFNDSCYFISLLDENQNLDEVIDPHRESFDQIILQSTNSTSNTNSTTGLEIGTVLKLFNIMYAKKEPTQKVLQCIMTHHRNNGDLISVIKSWGRLLKSHTPLPSTTLILLESCLELGKEKTATALKNSIKEEWLDNKCLRIIILLSVKFGDCYDVPRLVVEYCENKGCLRTLWRDMRELFKAKNDPDSLNRVTAFFEEFFPEIME